MADWFSARMLLAGFILLLATLLIVLVVGNLRKREPAERVDVVRRNTDLALQKINYTETEEGRRRWAVQADSASHDFSGRLATVENVRMVIYGQEGGDVVVTARQGSFDMEKSLLMLRGDVTLQNVSKQSIHAEDLEFFAERKLLVSAGAVRVESGGMQLTGVGMRYDLERNVFSLLSSVEAIFAGDQVRLP